jgi:hypothetical protein
MPSKKQPKPSAKSLTKQHRAAAAKQPNPLSCTSIGTALYDRDEAERAHFRMEGIARGTHWPYLLR